MNTLTDTSSAPTPSPQPEPTSSRVAMWLAVAAAFVAVAVAIVAVVVLVTDDDTTTDTSATTGTTATPTTTPSVSTTSAAPTTATSTPSSSTTADSTTTTDSSTTLTTIPDPTGRAVWPDPASSDRFTDPVDAAESFAVDALGMPDPVLGEFQSGDTRSGEVEARPSADGPITVILVRQLDASNSWFVVGSIAAEIVVDLPETLSVIESPVVVAGQVDAIADGNLEVELRVHGRAQPLATASAAASAGVATPFRFELPWTSDADWAQLVVTTRSEGAEGPTSAAAIAVRLR